MHTVVVTDPPRAAAGAVRRLGAFGVSTVHEAQGRTGYLGPGIRPAWAGAHAAGTAVTAVCWPGDNTMIHVAVEQCRPGDLLVVATTSPCSDGLFGELFATALRHRDVRGVVLGCGVRDVAQLRAMGFPVWSAAVSAQGTVKNTLGAVNVPIVLGGRRILPGDAVVGDDDGVVVVARRAVAATLAAAERRAATEEANRTRFAAGQLGLDVYEMRERLAGLGLQYVAYDESQEG